MSTVLDRVHKTESELACDLLLPFRIPLNVFGAGGIMLSRERADRLEQAICEALVQAYADGVACGQRDAPPDYYDKPPGI